MNAKVLFILSGVINAGLLGAIVYLSGLVTDQDYLPSLARFGVGAVVNAEAGRATPAPTTFQFGPVVEALLPSPGDTGRPDLLDLETGCRMTEPDFEQFVANPGANIAWIRTNGLDLSVVGDNSSAFSCIAYYLAILPVSTSQWDDATPADLLENQELRSVRDPKRSCIWPTRDQSDTFMFRTQEGTLGMLRVLGRTDDHRCLAIRYKLVRPQTPMPASGGDAPGVAANPEQPDTGL